MGSRFFGRYEILMDERKRFKNGFISCPKHVHLGQKINLTDSMWARTFEFIA